MSTRRCSRCAPYGAVSQRLFDAGALDVWTTPIQMKKGRPGVLLSVLASGAQAAAHRELLGDGAQLH